MGSLVIFRVDYKSREMPKPRNIIRAKINALKVNFNRYFSPSWDIMGEVTLETKLH